MSEHFDVLVLGGQPAGFWTAALLAKRGRRVALIDHGEAIDTYKQGGVTYPLRPLPLLGPIGFAPAEELMAELGVQTDYTRTWRPLTPSLQGIFREHRLDLHSDTPHTAAEVNREFPDSGDDFVHGAQQIDRLSNDLLTLLRREPVLPMPGWVQRFFQARRLGVAARLTAPSSQSDIFSKMSRHSGEGSDSGSVGQLLVEASSFASHWHDSDLSTAAFSLAADRVLAGSVQTDATQGSLDALEQVAKSCGVTVMRGVVVESIDASSRELRAVTLAHGGASSGKTVSADAFVSALYNPGLWQSVASSRTQQKLMNEQAKLRIHARLFFHHLLVDERAVVDGMADNLLLLNGRTSARDSAAADNAVWVTVRRGYGNGRALISAAIEVKETDTGSMPEQIAALKLRVRKQLERLLPFLGAHIVAESSPMAPAEWDAGAGRRLDPWLLHPRYEANPRALLGISGLPFHTPYSNLVRCGFETLPGLGNFGDFLRARMAADCIQLKKPQAKLSNSH